MTPGEPPVVRTDTHERTLVMTIDRPGARNAVDSRVAHGLADAVRRLEEDPGLRVGVLTGSEGVFSAGMDLKAAANGDSADVEGAGFAGLTEREPGKPLIAAVEGYAMGGGFEMALACDLVVAGTGAKFALPEVKRGLIAGGGGAARLPSRIPYHLAMELILTGDPITAERAAELGLVNRVTTDGAAEQEALNLAARLTENAPLAVSAAKRISRLAAHESERRALEAQRGEIRELLRSEDFAEGARAFAERRAPSWSAR
ncbi:enoyl-CoA hydratase [Actinopolyspora erythraea]|uniref:enoyl-CoA hydratase n=1 Tax=Actinopolyspora erythraea TaxID=414996 RepID=A0A099D806_9ACTN|nr:crotonase/enoyl-CoA hydratase family protein [Actinopolyspora erythraea]ASU78360.1 enoyl-CoA hydratase [Actinopolyspora erythraea]KGI81947.1 enoyl-CoA hydratase [Actinopolyspora erythraea]